MENHLTWKTLHQDKTSVTQRAFIPTGWLISNTIYSGQNIATSTVFISDPSHSWVVHAGEDG